MGSDVTGISEADLDKVFGPDSHGSSVTERARNSRRQFVRGQTMLAEASEEATGHKLAAAEALANFDFATLLAAVENGQAVIVTERAEPAQTLMRHRDALGYTREHLARLAKLRVDEVINAETPGKISPIRILERLALPLAIDERILGFKEQPHSEALGVRLRQLANRDGANRLSASAVAALAEGAWVIARQRALAEQLDDGVGAARNQFEPNDDYGYPTYQIGYQLAAETRRRLRLDPELPIESMRSLISDTLDIPLVQTKLGTSFAGATVANGTERGIVVNIDGANENVWVRRMTLAHELGHLLWDPAQRLEKLMVDRYDDLKVNSPDRRDPVEIRANAFAIALLAPPPAVDRIVQEADDIPSAIYQVASHFGISVTAAAAHVGNVSRVQVALPRDRPRPEPSDEMRAQEDFTVDYFPLKNVPPAVVGRFAWVVARALTANLISHDTAAGLLRAQPKDLDAQTIANILDVSGPR